MKKNFKTFLIIGAVVGGIIGWGIRGKDLTFKEVFFRDTTYTDNYGIKYSYGTVSYTPYIQNNN